MDRTSVAAGGAARPLELETGRRELMLGPMLAPAAMALGLRAGQAAGVDPAMTIIKTPDEIPWKPLYNFPPGMAESAAMAGAIDAPGRISS